MNRRQFHQQRGGAFDLGDLSPKILLGRESIVVENKASHGYHTLASRNFLEPGAGTAFFYHQQLVSAVTSIQLAQCDNRP